MGTPPGLQITHTTYVTTYVTKTQYTQKHQVSTTPFVATPCLRHVQFRNLAFRTVLKNLTKVRTTTLGAQPSSPTCNVVARSRRLAARLPGLQPSNHPAHWRHGATFAKLVRIKTCPLAFRASHVKPSLSFSFVRLIAGLPFGAGN